jgi:hypothetical protein
MAKSTPKSTKSRRGVVGIAVGGSGKRQRDDGAAANRRLAMDIVRAHHFQLPVDQTKKELAEARRVALGLHTKLGVIGLRRQDPAYDRDEDHLDAAYQAADEAYDAAHKVYERLYVKDLNLRAALEEYDTMLREFGDT